MPEAGLVGGDLHGDGEESVVVAVDVGLEESLELGGAGHSGSRRPESHADAPQAGGGSGGVGRRHAGRLQEAAGSAGHRTPSIVYM